MDAIFRKGQGGVNQQIHAGDWAIYDDLCLSEHNKTAKIPNTATGYSISLNSQSCINIVACIWFMRDKMFSIL